MFAIGAATAQTPQPAPSATPAALSDNLPVPDAPAPAVSKSWVLMDYATGQVLAGENIDTPVEPASITKVMTSYVIAAEMAAGKIKASRYPMDAKARDQLWASLVRAGWRLTEE